MMPPTSESLLAAAREPAGARAHWDAAFATYGRSGDGKKSELLAGVVDELDQAIGARRAVLGIDSVIASALDGAGRLLLVEDGYSAFGTVRPSGGVEVHDRADAFDLVEFAVATVLDKGGSVEGVGRNELGGDAGLGLLLRY